MTELTKAVGVSTTLIAAACQEHQVPTPPRGYWSKVRAGKPTSKIRLPARPPGMSNCIRLGRPRNGANSSPPEFEMSIDDLRAQVFSAIRISQHIPKIHRNPAKRIERIWHCLSHALADFSATIIPDVDEPTSAIIQIYHHSIFAVFEVCDVAENDQLSGTIPSSPMVTITKQGGTNEPFKTWRDTQEAALEALLQEIATEIVVLAEIKERDAQTARYERQVALRNQDRINQLERDAQRRKEVETQSAARLSSLLELAKRHEQANTLRCLLAEVDAAYPSATDLEIRRWRSMVASEIERLDPLVDKRFLTVLGIYSHSFEAA